MQNKVFENLTIEYEEYCRGCPDVDFTDSRILYTDNRKCQVLSCKNSQVCAGLYRHLEEKRKAVKNDNN